MYYSIQPLAPFEDATDHIDLDFVRRWVRVDESEVDFLNTLLIAALSEAENTCNQPMFERDYSVTLSAFTAGKIPALNIPDSLTITTTYTLHGSDTPIPVDTGLIKHCNGGVCFDNSLLSLTGVNNVTMKFKLGYPKGDLPGVIQMALCYIVNFYYDNRDNGLRTLPTVADNLLQPYKLFSV